MSIVNSKIIHFYVNVRYRTPFKKIFFAFLPLCCIFCAIKGLFRPISERCFSRKGELTIAKEISSKEKLFCTYYSLDRNGREAAAKSGYLFPEKSALRLLKRKEIKDFIEELDKQRRADKKDIAQGYVRLAFGCVSDAIKLLYCEESEKESIEQMDLFNISEIKRKKGGDIEIKFFDRLKALEKLQQLCDEKDTFSSASLYSAIAASATALKEDKLE